MLATLEFNLILVVLILARLEFGSNLNSSYISHADLIIISTVPSYTSQIGI